MIISAAFLPHCPALIPEIGKEKIDQVVKMKECYNEVIAIFQAKGVENVIIVSGQTIPFIDMFTINKSESLEGDFSLFEYDYQFQIKNNLKLVKSIEAEGEKNNLKIHSFEAPLDFGQSIPLYLLKEKMNINATVVHISLDSPINHKKLGEIIAINTQNTPDKTGLIITADLSNRVDEKISPDYTKDAKKWNLKFLEIMGSDVSHLSKLDPFITEDVGGAYPMRAASVLEGVFSRYLYKPLSTEYEEAFGVGYGAVVYDLL